MRSDCTSASGDVKNSLTSAANSICGFFDERKKPLDHIKTAAQNIKAVAQAPVKIAQDIISNPISGLLKAPLRIASAASAAYSAVNNTAAAAAKTIVRPDQQDQHQKNQVRTRTR